MSDSSIAFSHKQIYIDRLNTQDGERQNTASGGKHSPQPGVTSASGAKPATTEKAIEGNIKNGDTELKFQINKSTSDVVITVWNVKTGELVRQIPTKEMVAIAQHIAENIPDVDRGLFIDKNE